MSTDEQIVEESVHDSKSSRGRKALLALLVLGLLAMFTGGIAGWIAYTSVQDQAKQATSLAEQVQDACQDNVPDEQALKELCEQANDVVRDAPEAATPTRGEKGEPGQPGEPGRPPTDAEVADAVARYCAANRCRGSDGRNATPSQVAQAVATYCDSRGECSGPQGDRGPGPTGEQVATAVAVYCGARNECQGPQGEQGPPGPQGEQGPPGPAGQDGQTGVVDVNSNCDAPDGQVIDQVNAAYDGGTRTITLTCTFKPDAGTIPGGPG